MNNKEWKKFCKELKAKENAKGTGKNESKLDKFIHTMDRLAVTKVKETQCTCGMCGSVWHYNKQDVNKNETNKIGTIGHLLAGSSTTAAVLSSNIKDLNQCPKCGSRKISKKEMTFLVDRKGNDIDAK